MAATFILNNEENRSDYIRVTKSTLNQFIVDYAYDVLIKDHNTVPPYKFTKLFATFNELQKYFETMSCLLALDLKMPKTVDIQMEGHPCILVSGTEFVNMLKSSFFYDGIHTSVNFTTLKCE